MRKSIFSLIVCMLMLSGTAALAEEPALNVSQRLHPNIAAAQKLSRQAYNNLTP